ncbi:class I SAM-dependent methyltransferase [Dokdonella sp.]|uniref:class I SAM-dependent methyltransferase n=1 Tax=Dokdonella sp. TaxID=2291710 RepID=UPI002F3E6D6A
MSAVDLDDVLDALFLPLAQGFVATPAHADDARRGAFLRARAGAWLTRWRDAFACVQTFKPFADALERSGARLVDVAPPSAPLVLCLPPRQRDEARALFAQAVRVAASGGVVVACQPNNEGARSGAADLERLAGALQGASRHKCRVYWTSPLDARVDAALVAEWGALDAVRPIAGGAWLSRPGLFAWDRVDAASALLAEHLPPALGPRVADLGAGFGYLACEIVRRCAGVETLDLYEAEARAREPAEANLLAALAASQRAIATAFLWHDVTRGLPRRYDAIVSNPPFHQGRADDPGLGRAFIESAASALEPRGVLLLVANRHLAYEATLATRFATVRVLVERDGFKVIEAKEPRA